jgi:hypothetical protein
MPFSARAILPEIMSWPSRNGTRRNLPAPHPLSPDPKSPRTRNSRVPEAFFHHH